MVKKSKKTASARGFSTVSTPSKASTQKAEAPGANHEDHVELPVGNAKVQSIPNKDLPVIHPQQALPCAKNDESEKVIVEEEASQLAKRFASLNDFKSVAMLNHLSHPQAALSQERRAFGLPEGLEHEMLQFVKNSNRGLDKCPLGYQSSQKDRYNVIAKLDVVYRSLEKLGFDILDIERSLEASTSLAIEDHLDWLCINVPYDRLPSDFFDKYFTEEKGSFTLKPNASSSDTAPLEQETTQPSMKVISKEDEANAIDKDHKTRILQSALQYEYEEEEEEDVNEKHATTKAEIHDIEYKLHPPKKGKKSKNVTESLSPSVIQEMEVRLKKLKETVDILERDWDFDKEKAGKLYVGLLQKASDERLAVLKGQVAKQNQKEPELESAIVPDIFDEADDDQDDGLFGGLLGDEVESQTMNTSVNQVTSFSMVKEFSTSWKGRYPKELLKDYCQKHGYACGSYSRSNPTYGVWRASVTVHTQGRNVPPINASIPDDIAATTRLDAEQIAATVALFKLDPKSSVFRVLPTELKDLWLEWLEAMERLKEQPRIEKERKRVQFIIDLVDQSWEELKHHPSAKRIIDICDQPLEDEATSSSKETSVRKRKRLFTKMQKEFKGRESTDHYLKMKDKRSELPITAFRDEILSMVERHQVVIVSGETGCGKSTQVPQLLAEALLNSSESSGSIICTQPRRISAISIANRVSLEMGDVRGSTGKAGSMVGYQIRLESKMSEDNILLFCTTGILLRRLEGDAKLEGVSHVIVDEVHERTIESDFLLIILRRLCSVRKDLRVVLMSATVNADRFAAYFDGCPVLCVPGRTFPVQVQYLEDVVEATKYVLEEDSPYAKRHLRQSKGRGTVEIGGRHGSSQRVTYEVYEEDSDSDTTYNPSIPESKLLMSSDMEKLDNVEDGEDSIQYSKQTRRMIKRMDEDKINYEIMLQLVEHICLKSAEIPEESAIPTSGAILIFLPGMTEIRKLYDLLESHGTLGDSTKFLLIALHSTLSSEHQERAFDVPPPGVRKIVLSTNIAETGVTISDITVVIDTGMAKTVSYDEKKRITRLRQAFVSKANVLQRRGRAGRVQEGVCFHLFSRGRFEQMVPYEKPEILRLPLQETCLRIKVCRLGAIHDVFGEALDAPSQKMIDDAIEALQEVQALSADEHESLTPLGVHLSNLPVDVHVGKMLLFGAIFKCLDPILTVAAALSFKGPFVRPFGQEREAEEARRKFIQADSDFLTIYNAYRCWREEMNKVRGKPGWIRKMRDFCKKNYLSQQNLEMIEDMKRQFLGLLISIKFVDAGTADVKEKYEIKRMARMCNVPPAYDTYSTSINVINAAITAGVYPKIAVFSRKTCRLERKDLTLLVHPSSVLFSCQQKLVTDFVAYNLIAMNQEKVYLWDAASIDVVALFLLASTMEIKHTHRLVTLDGWLPFKCSARTAVLLKSLRQQLDTWFSAKMESPDLDLSEFNPDIMEILVKTLEAPSYSPVTARMSR